MTHYPLLLHGDALDILPTLIAGTVDVVVEDRPAGIGFMGKAWDSFATYEPRSERGHEVLNGLDLLGGMPRWASGFVTFMVELNVQVDRVLKPGGFVCSWALPKTADLAGLAMRLTGWTIHESVLHLFGSGMNKAGDIGKQIDKAAGAERVREPLENPKMSSGTANGWGADGHSPTAPLAGTVAVNTALTEDAKRWTGWHSQIAPGHEQWLIGQKPGRHTYARQLVERGCGAFNVDACRVPRGEEGHSSAKSAGSGSGRSSENCYGEGLGGVVAPAHPSGSHPRNVVLTAGGPGCPVKGLDRQSGVLTSGTGAFVRATSGPNAGAVFGTHNRAEGTQCITHGDSGGASRYFTRFGAGPAWATAPAIGSRADVRARAQRVLASMGGGVLVELPEEAACDEVTVAQRWALPPLFDAKVGYFPKASDRSVPGRPDLTNPHCCLKNRQLMRWLVRLMAATAEHTGGAPAVVLDPCMGSGTTGWACAAEGVSFIGIERDPVSIRSIRCAGPGGVPGPRHAQLSTGAGRSRIRTRHTLPDETRSLAPCLWPPSVALPDEPLSFYVARARILGASGSIEEAQRGNDGAEVGSQLGLL